jgi:1-deoxy-D-xylulose-5-phosphate reductoisomerase
MTLITILGSTGTIGANTLAVLDANPEFSVLGLSGGDNYEKLAEQATKYNAKIVAIKNESKYKELKVLLPNTKVLAGDSGVLELASEQVDVNLCAISGSSGLLPAFAAMDNCKRLALATKEAIIMGGQVFMDKLAGSRCELIPVDSEHNSIFNSLKGDVKRVVITASGGAFIDRQDLSTITYAEATRHPIWNMGSKITIDSSSLMNKALELIEAHILFSLPAEKLEVKVHRQSIIHSIVELRDMMSFAVMYEPDMKVPIANSIGAKYSGAKTLSFATMTFEDVDSTRFPSINLAYRAIRENKGLVLNAANEVAVDLFSQGKIKFTDIFAMVEAALDFNLPSLNNLKDILLADKEVRLSLGSWSI